MFGFCCNHKKVDSHSIGIACLSVHWSFHFSDEQLGLPLVSVRYGGGAGKEERSGTQEGNLMFVVSH